MILVSIIIFILIIILIIVFYMLSSENYSNLNCPWIFKEGEMLKYKTYNKGCTIMDFSSVGYMNGEQSIPLINYPNAAILYPNNTDDTDNIQNAINNNNLVLLSEGIFIVNRQLNILKSNVVLRGAGRNKTTIRTNNKTPFNFINIAASIVPEKIRENKVTMSKIVDYVPVGSKIINVENSSKYSIGDEILVVKIITEKFINSLGMNKLTRDSKPQVWLKSGSKSYFERKIKQIDNGIITLDVPLSDDIPMDSSSYVVKYELNRINNVGLEDFRIIGLKNNAKMFVEPMYTFITIRQAENSWLKNVSGLDFIMGLTISSCRQLTVENVILYNKPGYGYSGARPFDINIEQSQQLLFLNCQAKSNNSINFATSSLTNGPNVAYGLDTRPVGDVNANEIRLVEPHHRWATGLLIDNSRGYTLNFINRRNMGSGHGWSVANSVVYNSDYVQYTIDSPPGYKNFGIGVTGENVKSTGELCDKDDGMNSLYYAQLKARLGTL
jgi:hypothetical protein